MYLFHESVAETNHFHCYTMTSMLSKHCFVQYTFVHKMIWIIVCSLEFVIHWELRQTSSVWNGTEWCSISQEPISILLLLTTTPPSKKNFYTVVGYCLNLPFLLIIVLLQRENLWQCSNETKNKVQTHDFQLPCSIMM